MRDLGNRVLSALAMSAIIGSAGPACATSFKFTALNTDGADLATPEAINSRDQVVGITNNSNGYRVGFVWSSGTLATVDGSLELSAINDSGVAVGPPWLNEKGYYVTFDVKSGVLTEVPVNIDLHGKQVDYATGINAAGEIVGVADGGKYIGFTTVNGQSNKLLPPNQTESFPAGINQKGDVVIDYHGDLTDYPSFLYSKGKFKNISVPGASTTTAVFISNDDMIGGSFTASGSTSGFLFSRGTYTTYSPAGATSSTVSGVGPSGQVYGTYIDAAGSTHGFENIGGAFYQIDVPNSTYTNILAVGTSGSIVGFYRTSQGGAYGYIGRCPKKDVCTQ